ncbi:MAG: lipopolysaccharide biosynthesis protein [Syntrophothermus sp.]
MSETATRPHRLQALRAQIAHNREVLTNATSMMGTTAVTAGLGAAFWLIAARQFSADAVGVASAAVSAMMLLGYLATAGLGTLLMGELPRRDSGHRGLLNAALLVSGAIGAALGIAFAILAPLVSPDLDPLSESATAVVVFAIGVGLTGLTTVLDQALIGLLRGNLQLSRNVVFSVVKLLVLAVAGLALTSAGGVWIYAAWTLGIAVSLVVLAGFYRHRGADTVRPTFAELSAMRIEAATHHIYNLAIRAPDLALPLIVVSTLSAAANANFYIAWMIASFGFMVPVSLSSVLFAVGSADSVGLHSRYRLSIGLSAGLGVVINLFLLVAGGTILSLFGSSYEQGALATLQILALGVFPETVKAHFLSIVRVERRIARTIPLVIGGTVLELGAALAGGLSGKLTLVAAGWLAAVCVEALVMSWTVFRFLRLRPPSLPHAAGRRAPGTGTAREP